MKKLIYLIGILFLIQVINADSLPDVYDLNGVQPVNEYTFIKQETENTVKLTRASRPLFYQDNGLKVINQIFTESTNENWLYEINESIYKLKIREDGTFQYENANQVIQAKIKGLVFFNIQTKERIIRADYNFGIPTNEGDRIVWQLPHDSNYVIYNTENKHFKDVLTLSETIKTHLRNSRPTGWALYNTFVGLIYDFNFNGTANLNDIETFEPINFFVDGKKEFYIRKSFAFHSDYNKGFSGSDFNVNWDLRWNKLKKIIRNRNLYLEIISIQALFSQEGSLIFNGTITENVFAGEDDCDESGVGVLDCIDTKLVLSSAQYGAGIMFRTIPIESDTTISEAILTIKHTYTCIQAGNCNNTVYGNNRQDINAWNTPDNKPSDSNHTTNSTSFNLDSDFTPNGSYASTDLNVTDLVSEIINHSNYEVDSNLSFDIKTGSYGRTTVIHVLSYESIFPEPKLVITFEGEIEYCKPTLNQDWYITDKNLICENKQIVVGTANTFLNSNSLLTLINSNLFIKGLFSFTFPNIIDEQETFDANLYCDSNFSATFPCKKAINPLTEDFGDRTYDDYWLAGNLGATVDHNIMVNLPLQAYNYVQFPIYWAFSWSSDITIQYYNGGWINLFSDSSFTPAECHADFNYSGGCWCDMNLLIPEDTNNVRVLFAKNSYSDGCVFSTFDGMIGMGNITPFYDNHNIRKEYLILSNSTGNVS